MNNVRSFCQSKSYYAMEAINGQCLCLEIPGTAKQITSVSLFLAVWW